VARPPRRTIYGGNRLIYADSRAAVIASTRQSDFRKPATKKQKRNRLRRLRLVRRRERGGGPLSRSATSLRLRLIRLPQIVVAVVVFAVLVHTASVTVAMLIVRHARPLTIAAVG
jgi:hypothetical protein